MKNDIDKLDELPLKENRASNLTRRYGNMWDVLEYRYPSDKAERPYVKAERVIKKFIGKNYGKAFSIYCDLVKQFEQHVFFDDFFEKPAGSIWEPKYIIDKQNRIQINKAKLRQDAKRRADKKAKGVWFKSIDYETGYMHNQTGKIIDRNEYYRITNHWDASRKSRVNNNYTEIIVSGYAKHFKSEKDPEYIRLMAEYRKQLALNDKLIKKYKRAKAYSFLSRDEIQRKKLDALDAIKIESHGFNDESFKGIEYHGQKRKIEKE